MSASLPLLTVETLRLAGDWPEEGLDRLIGEVARSAYRHASPALAGARASVCIVLSDDTEVQSLNKRFRGIDKPTNVLSFPSAAAPVLPERPLGDVILARETLEREAAELSLCVPHHAAHLVAHGVLHLMGFDHGTDAEAGRMEALERRILAGHGIADPYAAHDRAGDVHTHG
jgi:probable rRNA maturation factor